MKRAWAAKASKQYRNLTADARFRGIKPSLLSPKAWVTWQEFYKSADYLTMSERNRRNRRGGGDLDEPAPGTHAGGSITFHRLHQILVKYHSIIPSVLRILSYIVHLLI